jgi:hypothetical protein
MVGVLKAAFVHRFVLARFHAAFFANAKQKEREKMTGKKVMVGETNDARSKPYFTK